MKNSLFLKIWLSVATAVVLIYTSVTMYYFGFNFTDVFYSNITSLNWSGQFSIDFSAYLMLSGVWIMWRNKFAKKSIIIGLLSSIFGVLIFFPYLLYLLYTEKGDIVGVLTGERKLREI